ncbi:Sieve element occlusion, C-terminal [Dillenia turbinata]|uniref:Sieve element occlusion, C-terminal n=1 Tax=Dillenia turbinata TaxID=194707 RepID=A0AAN8Z147_9MAGN
MTNIGHRRIASNPRYSISDKTKMAIKDSSEAMVECFKDAKTWMVNMKDEKFLEALKKELQSKYHKRHRCNMTLPSKYEDVVGIVKCPVCEAPIDVVVMIKYSCRGKKRVVKGEKR